MYRVGTLEQPIFKRAIWRLARDIEDRAVHIELPAVIAAANAIFLDFTERQRRAAVAAPLLTPCAA